MWTRKQLKDNAKVRMSANYWKAVLAALILTLVVGEGGASFNYSFDSGNGLGNIFNRNTISSDINEAADEIRDAADEIREAGKEAADDIRDAAEEVKDAADDSTAVLVYPDGMEGLSESLDDFADAVTSRVEKSGDNVLDGTLAAIVASVFIAVLAVILVASAIGICLSIFLLNPLAVGGRRFFVLNHDMEATVREFGFSFKSNYMNVVKVMFFKDLFIFLWSLLFFIPGIIKSYEYRMIDYILAENPNIDREEAFAMSKKMMTGNKWDAFVLDLSFIGWHLLNALTCGILGIFYVNPYRYQTEAELYIALKNTQPAIESNDTVSYDNYVEVH